MLIFQRSRGLATMVAMCGLGDSPLLDLGAGHGLASNCLWNKVHSVV